MKTSVLIVLSSAVLTAAAAFAQAESPIENLPIAEGKFKPTDESLQMYR